MKGKRKLKEWLNSRILTKSIWIDQNQVLTWELKKIWNYTKAYFKERMTKQGDSEVFQDLLHGTAVRLTEKLKFCLMEMVKINLLMNIINLNI